ncbi:MAG: SGNH hydrolase domain-containing protein, partial [Dermatophilaceae bacterium]
TTTPTPTHRAIAITLTLWLAVVSYPVVETPFRRVQATATRHRRTLGFGAATIASSLVLASGAAALVPDARGTGAAGRELDAGLTELAEVRRGAATKDVPSNLTPALDIAVRDDPDRAVQGAEHCHANLLESEISDNGSPCVFGDPKGSTTVVLTGDSHAYQWLPALDQLARSKRWRLVSMTKAACALYDVKLENQTLDRDYRECYTWREKVTARIATERASLVITTGAIFNSRGAEFAEQWASGVGTTVRSLAAGGSRVAVLEDVPFPGRDIPKCLAAHLDRATSCTTPVDQAMSDLARRAGTREQAAAAGATVIDPTPWFCTSTTCAVIVGNTLVHRDNSHVTASYARALIPRLAQSLPAPFGAGATS